MNLKFAEKICKIYILCYASTVNSWFDRINKMYYVGLLQQCSNMGSCSNLNSCGNVVILPPASMWPIVLMSNCGIVESLVLVAL